MSTIIYGADEMNMHVGYGEVPNVTYGGEQGGWEILYIEPGLFLYDVNGAYAPTYEAVWQTTSYEVTPTTFVKYNGNGVQIIPGTGYNDTTDQNDWINLDSGQTIYLKLFEEFRYNYESNEYEEDPTQVYIALIRGSEINDDNNNVIGYNFSYATAPVCLTDTCDVLTPNGYVNVKHLSVGDEVTTLEGENVKITKVMKPTDHYATGKAYPHFIPKNSLGENKPTKDTFISKNHAYKSGDEWLCGQFNIEHNAINWDQEFVTYYNIMTEDYPKHSLVVNGIEMEAWGGYEHNKPQTHKNVKLRREKLGFK